MLPDRLEIELHIYPHNLARSTGFSIPLYRDGKSIWRQGADAAGQIDVAVIADVTEEIYVLLGNLYGAEYEPRMAMEAYQYESVLCRNKAFIEDCSSSRSSCTDR